MSNIRIKYFICFLTLVIETVQIKAYNEVMVNNSFAIIPNIVLIQRDSLLQNYYKIKKDYNEKKYSISLEKSLALLNKVNQGNKTDQIELKYLVTFLIGDIFRKINNHDKSLSYFKKSLSILINEKEKNTYDTEQKNLSIFNENSQLAKNLLRISVILGQKEKIDSSKYYLKKIILIPESNKNIISTKASAYSNLSGIYTKEKKYDSARIYASNAIKSHRINKNKTSQAAALGNLASIFLEEEKYNEAKNTYLKGLNLIEKDNSNKANKYKEYLYFNLAYTLYLLKDYKAYNYQEKSYNIKDSLRDDEIRKVVARIYTKSNLDIEKEKTNFVKNQANLVKAQQKKTSMLFGALSLLVIVISGVVVYNYKLRQKNLSLKLSENNLIQQQRIEKIKSDSQTKILNATIDGKESERKEIAEILHDNVSALLSSANMHLSATKKQFSGKTPLEIEKTQAIILEASQKVRDLSHNLISSILLKFGLEYAVKDVAKKYSNSQLKFEVCAQNISRYNQEFEIKIFNVIQELANNILKHSKANRAKISIKQEKNQLTVLVNDDGVGFSTSSSSINNGIGLNQVEARIEMMNGKLFIDSKKNKGTRISIVIPIQQKKHLNFHR